MNNIDKLNDISHEIKKKNFNKALLKINQIILFNKNIKLQKIYNKILILESQINQMKLFKKIIIDLNNLIEEEVFNENNNS